MAVCLASHCTADQIVEILQFREKVLRTGMKPSTSVAEDMCKELHPKCYSKSKSSPALADEA